MNVQNKQKWQLLLENFKNTDEYRKLNATEIWPAFFKWLQEHYKAPKRLLDKLNKH